MKVQELFSKAPSAANGAMRAATHSIHALPLATLATRLVSRPVLIAALVSEGVLCVLALAILRVADLKLLWNVSTWNITLGVLLTIPPLILNSLLWRASERRPHSIYARFSREVITPLCRHMPLPTAAVVAILSGVCEELFFRGALNYFLLKHAGATTALITTSVVFAAVHFIGNFRRYGRMIPLYSLMGAYLWIAHAATGSLASVAILHGLYNFIVIALVRRKLSNSQRIS